MNYCIPSPSLSIMRVWITADDRMGLTNFLISDSKLSGQFSLKADQSESSNYYILFCNWLNRIYLEIVGLALLNQSGEASVKRLVMTANWSVFSHKNLVLSQNRLLCDEDQKIISFDRVGWIILNNYTGNIVIKTQFIS